MKIETLTKRPVTRALVASGTSDRSRSTSSITRRPVLSIELRKLGPYNIRVAVCRLLF